ncbi:MAG: bifunctional hydroxymethylpyrimidine kinase/phosphomethylpyrimidine kinase [Verrucomicrobia bacterium]|nr:bifunctional hydroxymethylpyrimidine kinase/phosphomethylpyrimidine kinase [Verrucomicrobiota bacterium]
MIPAPPVALSIAGSDCSAGAGIQADLKTFQHFRVHGLTAVTCVVSETAEVVRAVHPVPVNVVADQLSLMLESFPVAAIKTGMLYSAAHVEAVASILERQRLPRLVVDPVMVASTGDPLLEADAVDAYRLRLLPLARLITPNLPEAEVLLGRGIRDAAGLEPAARELAAMFGTAVLLKGGHLEGDDCIDVLVEDGEVSRFTARRIPLPGSHGTGCTFSAAITAALAHGDHLADAVARAKAFLGEALAGSYRFEASGGPRIHALNQSTVRLPEMRDGRSDRITIG